MNILELPKSLKLVPYTQGFYVARYFHLAFDKAKTKSYYIFNVITKVALIPKVF